MAMTQAKLASELNVMDPTGDSALAAQRLAQAYANYCADATALTPILPAGVELGRVAMQSALLGMNTGGQAVFEAGILAFWTAVAGGLTLSFAAAIAITPPTNAFNFAPAYDLNLAGGVTKAQATANIAAVWHPATIVGGTVSTPGIPVIVTPII